MSCIFAELLLLIIIHLTNFFLRSCKVAELFYLYFMAIAELIKSQDNRTETVWIFCPGCNTHHAFTVKAPQGPVWGWNGSLDKPTFTPSMLVNGDYPDSRCHSFVTDGKIKFLGDCFHDMKNTTVDLPAID